MTAGFCLMMSLMLLLAAPLAAQSSDLHVRVDQFGYHPLASKVAVLREPVIGYDAPAPYTPGALIEVRRAADHSTVFSGAPAIWQGGAVHADSGDHVWWFDFTAHEEEGTFYIHDPANGVSSETFRIAPDVYAPVLEQAVRMYYYQRCGIAKASPFTPPDWADTECHVGAEQDLDCRSVLNPVPFTSLDLSGGWHDAGDYNKYVNYTDGAIHDLLGAFEVHPDGWSDDFGLPESGNSVPDLLDEIKWELDWLLKMQIADGSVLHKMGVTTYDAASPPSNDAGARRYAPPTASATVSACGAFAHASLVFGSFDAPAMKAYAAELRDAALAAWDWLEANPGAIPSYYNNAGFVSAAAEDDSYRQEMNRLRAAAYLLALTGEARFRTWFDSSYTTALLFVWWWASPWEQETQDGLLFYALHPDATQAVSDDILARYELLLSGQDNLQRVLNHEDAYRAFIFSNDYTWGSNRVKAQQGLMYAAMNLAGLDPDHARDYVEAAEGFLHYLHGVNPTGYCFLTNMSDHGAEGSVNEMYHGWFADGTVWDNATTSLYGPPPGYLTGGANQYFAPDPVHYTGPPIEPPENQPPQKSYLDWNTGWPENSYEVTECHIPYQAAYVRLLACFAAGPRPALSLGSAVLTGGQTAQFIVGGAGTGSPVAVLWSLQTGPYQFSAPGWTLDLRIDLGAYPAGRVALMGTAGVGGVYGDSLTVPPAAVGLTVLFQAAEGGTAPYPVHSAVLVRKVQ